MPDPGTLRLDGVKQNRCTICNGSHSEKHRPYECKGWHNVSLQSEGEVRSCEQQARNSTNEWLWERGGASFPGACLIDREADGSKLGLISATGSRMIPHVEGVIPGVLLSENCNRLVFERVSLGSMLRAVGRWCRWITMQV